MDVYGGELKGILRERLLFRLTPGCQPGRQAEVARLLGANQPKVSALTHDKLDGFSVERLMAFLNALGRDVEIMVRKKPRSRAKARTSVVAVSGSGAPF